jgi:hypothetical protein
MGDIAPDGAPIETPEAGAAEAYEGIPATLGEFLSPQAGSTARQIARVGEQGMYEGAGWFPQLVYGLTQAGATSPEVGARAGDFPTAPPPASVPSPMLSPAEYNAKYAPEGPDGKPVSLGSQPMPDAVAKLVGDAKREEIERENVTARFENAHSWPTNFAAGTLGFMLDPIRAATAFMPGIGEEAILARLGGGVAAKIGARVVAGGVSGAVAQAPLSGLEYGLGLEEASDYGLRDAFRDIAFAAAGNAVIHAGIGTAADILRGRPAVAAAEERSIETAEAAEAVPILSADAQTKHAAMSSAVAEMVDGRPIDVEPMFQLKTPEPIAGLQFLPPPPRPIRPSDVATQQQELYHDGFAPGVPDSDLKQANADIYEPVPAETETQAAPTVSRETQPTPAGEPPKPLAETDPELAAAHDRIDQLQGSLLPEERAELEQARGGLADADQHAAAIDEAAACLKGSGL